MYSVFNYVVVESTFANFSFFCFIHKYGAPYPQLSAHGSRPMPPLPDMWTQAQTPQQPRGPHSHSGQLKRPGPLLESTLSFSIPCSISVPAHGGLPQSEQEKENSGSEQVS